MARQQIEKRFLSFSEKTSKEKCIRPFSMCLLCLIFTLLRLISEPVNEFEVEASAQFAKHSFEVCTAYKFDKTRTTQCICSRAGDLNARYANFTRFMKLFTTRTHKRF